MVDNDSSAIIKRRSSGIVLYKRTPDDCLFLILRAYSNWDFPKGNIEQGESPIQAAIRETKEETGILELNFKHGFIFNDTEIYNKDKVARYFIAEVSTKISHITIPPNPKTGVREHHGFRWANHQQLQISLPPRLLSIADWANSIVNVKD